MLARTVFLALSIAGCGGGVHSNPLADAPTGDDDIDAPPDTPVELAAHHYVIDGETLPTTNTEARALGLDLNTDGTVDNQLGMVLATFSSDGIDVQQHADIAVNRGEILLLIEASFADPGAGPGQLAVFTGANAQPAPCATTGDTACRHHLDGNGTFDVAADSARDAPLTGTFAAGALVAGGAGGSDGKLRIQTTMLAREPVTLNLIGARMKVTGVTGTQIESGIIAGAVVRSEVDGQIIPAFSHELTVQLAAFCPGAPPDCACIPSSPGKSIHDLFDADRDCQVSIAELQNNALVQSLLAPDVTIGGQQALSLGFGFSAVGGTFTP